MNSLTTLVARLKERNLLIQYVPGINKVFDRLVVDSREVGPKDCFVAIRGEQTDGHLFIDKAVINGAAALVCEVAPANPATGIAGAALVHVRDSRRALAEGASFIHDDPGRALMMAGITGTNGKTTTAYLIRHLFTGLGRPAGLLGTTGYAFGDQFYEASLTTPDAVRLYGLLRDMQREGCTACAMEVSSHALEQSRVLVRDFDLAVFTNLTRDHLDYHKTFDAYLSTKKLLFEGLSREAVAVANADDESTAMMLSGIKATAVTYGTERGAGIRFRIIDENRDGLSLAIDGREIGVPLHGAFNGYNVAAAYAVGVSLGHSPQQVSDILRSSPMIPGRFEMMCDPRNRAIIVDFAHTPDALERALAAARRLVPEGARLWCVFGCGGDRDSGKRAIMGEIAERMSDRVIVTSDNPRKENPEDIIEDILMGMSRPEDAIAICDRAAAIARAANDAESGDLILLAGKGHENYQVLGTERLPFNDRATVTKTFQISTGAQTAGTTH